MSTNIYTAEQQAEIDSVIAECAEKRTEIARQIEAYDREIEGHNKRTAERDRHDAVVELVSGHTWTSPSARIAAIQLVKGSLDFIDGSLSPVNQDGAPLVGAGGFMTAAEFMDDFRKKNENMIKTTKPAQTGASSTEDPQESVASLRRLFGATSDGKAAQKAFMASPDNYRRLRAIARQKGVITF